MSMSKDKFVREFEGLWRVEDKHDVKNAWENRAKKAGIDLPKRGPLTLAAYVSEVRELVIEHERQHPKTEDTVAAIERCRMIVQPHGRGTGCDHEWYATASILDDDGAEFESVEGEGQTVAEAVKRCAEIYDAVVGLHASEPT